MIEVEFPFPGESFPPELGAIIQPTVLAGEEAARYVGHTPANRWLISDGVNDSNQQDGCVVAHIAHVAERDPSLSRPAVLPIGFEAERDERGSEWRVRQFAYGPESNQAEAFDTVRDSGTRIEMLCANATHPTV